MADETESTRRFPRVPSENVVLLQRLERGSEEELAKTGVIGLGGCMVVSRSALGSGSLVALAISVAGHVIKTEARVVWEHKQGPREYHAGLEFLRLFPGDRLLLNKLLDGPKGAG
jgi:hypothetical protein